MCKHKHTWPEVKKLCRLNQNDIAMAKSLGFGPQAEVEVPVKERIRELHSGRFGYVLGEKPLPEPPPSTPEEDEEAARIFGEQLYWEDYWDRNEDSHPEKRQPHKPSKGTTAGSR